MAQKILLRRGPVGNLSGVSTSQGELLLATGSVGDLSGPFVTMTGTPGPGASTVLGKIYEGAAAPTVTAQLTGLPFYSTNDSALYRLNSGGNEKLDLSGNLEGTTISDITVSGSFSGSFQGNGAGLTDIPASNIVLATIVDGNGIADFSYDGTTNVTISAEISGSTLSLTSAGLSVSDAGITSVELANNSVITDKILDGNVTNAKLANSSIYLAGGNGLTGDGSTALGASGSLAVGAGDGIAVTADAVSVDTGSNHFISGSRDAISVSDTTGASGINMSYTDGVVSGVLQNSSITLGSTSVDLGATATTVSALILEAAQVTGSFTGSFAGDGSQLTNLNLGSLSAPGNDTEVLYNNGGALDATSALTVSGNNLTVVGDITGSSLLLSGDANIDGNIVLGGNITIGNADTDNISLGGEFTSNLVPNADSTYDLGADAKRWLNIYVDNVSGSTADFSSNVNVGGTLDVAGALTVTADIDANDITIDGWNSVSASLASLQDNANALTLQDVTDNGATTTNNVQVAGLTVTGDLTVQGTTTTVDSTQVNIGDRIISLNAAGAAGDGGIEVTDAVDGTQGTGSLLWNATNDYWYAGMSGSTHYRLATYDSATPSTNLIQKVDASSRLVDSSLTDTGTAVTSSVPVLAAGILDSTSSANIRFSYINASKQFAYITPSTSGDLIQWNGSAMVASNVIDGGSF